MGKIVAVCRWKNCNKATNSLIDHINRRHIGSGERVYICEWENCVRRGVGCPFGILVMERIKKYNFQYLFSDRLHMHHKIERSK